MTNLILASSSTIRADILRNAGIVSTIVPATIDERAVEAPLIKAGLSPADLAIILAEAKARNVAQKFPGDMVIGCDQVLGLDERRYAKPQSMQAARRQLLELSGRTHSLNSAICCVCDDTVTWHTQETAYLTMRTLTPAQIGRYLARVGDPVLSSVGAYQLEGLGVRLFEKIEGDYFSILGLPILPLLAYLRDAGLGDL